MCGSTKFQVQPETRVINAFAFGFVVENANNMKQSFFLALEMVQNEETSCKEF